MFGEGCYLHTAIVLTYSTDKLRKWMFICIGWCKYQASPFTHWVPRVLVMGDAHLQPLLQPFLHPNSCKKAARSRRVRFAWPCHLARRFALCERIPVTAGTGCSVAPLRLVCVHLQVSPSPSSWPGPSGSCTTTTRSEPDCPRSPFSFLSQFPRDQLCQEPWRHGSCQQGLTPGRVPGEGGRGERSYSPLLPIILR